MDGASIVFVRSIICIGLSYAVISRLGISIWPTDPEERHTHLVRMTIAGLGTFLFHSSTTMLPLQIATVLVAASTPLNVFLQAIQGYIAQPQVWVCTAITFAGIVLVIDPSLLGIGSPVYSKDQVSRVGMLMAFTVALLYAVNRIFLSGRSRNHSCFRARLPCKRVHLLSRRYTHLWTDENESTFKISLFLAQFRCWSLIGSFRLWVSVHSLGEHSP